MYTLKPNITRLSSDPTIISECGPYVTRTSHGRLSWPLLLRLYTKLLPGTTIHDWIESNDIMKLGIDPRRFVSFGIIKGFLRRVHRWPVVIDRGSPLFNLPFDPIDGGKRRVEFDRKTEGERHHVERMDSSIALSSRTIGTTGTGNESTSIGHQSQLTRSGPGDSTFTLRSTGSNLSLGVSPGKTPSSLGLGLNKSPRRINQSIQASTLIHHKPGSLPRSLHSGPGGGGYGDSGISGITSSRKTPTGMLRAGSALKMRNNALAAQDARLFEEIIRFCDGGHHADELQVKFGLSWRDLEKILGLEGIRDGKVGKKGVVVIHR